MKRPFLIWPDPRLRRPAAPVAAVDAGVRALWEEMLEAMYAMPGVGLAAVQLGAMRALAVLDASPGRDRPLRLANPVLIAASEDTAAQTEASPNLPGVSAPVTRPRAVRVGFLNADGEAEEREFEDLWAASVQHQIDHLQGRMYFDRLSRVKRDMLLKKWNKSR